MAVEDVHLNGRLTLGENTADNGGLRISLMALANADGQGCARPPRPIDGFTPEQRFFLGFAQVWCQNSTPESSRLLAKTDPHSPGQYRVNGVAAEHARNCQKAFGCKAGQPMVERQRLPRLVNPHALGEIVNAASLGMRHFLVLPCASWIGSEAGAVVGVALHRPQSGCHGAPGSAQSREKSAKQSHKQGK